MPLPYSQVLTVVAAALVVMLGKGKAASAQATGETHATSAATDATAIPSPAATGSDAGYRVESPVPLTPLDVQYPPGATGEAVIVVELRLGRDGRVETAEVLEPLTPFAEVAVAAARGWVFTPARRIHRATGETTPLPAKIRVEVAFSPDKDVPVVDEQSGSGEPDTPNGAMPETPEVDVTVSGSPLQTRRRLSKTDVRLLPGAFGDPFRAVEVLPGVTPIASGLPFFYVRGAPPNNSGYFLGDIPLPSLFHVAGGPGVIHPAFIDSVTLYPSVAPVEYGRFAGALLASDPAHPEYRRRTDLSLRLIDAGAFSEAPFASGRGSVMVGGRYAYTGLLAPLFAPDVEVSYWDYQAKATYTANPRDTFNFFAFGAHDYLAAALNDNPRQTLYDVTFHRVHLDWVRTSNERTRWNFQVLGLWDETRAGSPNGSTSAALGRFGGSLQSKVSHVFTPRVGIAAGVSLNLERLDAVIDAVGEPNDEPPERDVTGQNLEILPRPGIPDNWEDLLVEARRARRQASLAGLLSPRDDIVAGAWLAILWKPTNRLTVTPGARLDHYTTGNYTALGVDPRVTARFRLTGSLTATHGVGIAHQPPSFGAPIPGLSASVQTGLQRALQSYAGVEWEHAEVTATGALFQSALFNGSDSLGLLNLQRSNVSADAAVDRSVGHSYGLEVSLQRPLARRWGGLVSYTLSRSTRAFGTISGPASFDRTHVVNAAVSYDLGRGVRAGVRAVLYSGVPAEVAYSAAAKAPPRGPLYLRLDWRLEKQWTVGDGGRVSLIAETLNTTLAKETLDVSCYAYGCSPNQIGPVTLPSLGVEASF